MFKTLIRAIQIAQALPRVANYISASGWLDPTEAQYKLAVIVGLKDIRLTAEERGTLIETFIELRDRVVESAVKNIKP